MRGKVKGVPENSSVVIPRLFCRDVASQVEFCMGVFDTADLGGRPGPDGKLVHALIAISSEMIMIEAEWPALPSRPPVADGTSPVVIFVYTEDVDRVVERAVARGATVLVPAQDQFWGDRSRGSWIPPATFGPSRRGSKRLRKSSGRIGGHRLCRKNLTRTRIEANFPNDALVPDAPAGHSLAAVRDHRGRRPRRVGVLRQVSLAGDRRGDRPGGRRASGRLCEGHSRVAVGEKTGTVEMLGGYSGRESTM